MGNLLLSKGEKLLVKAASIGAAVLGVVAVYTFYKNNIWHPKIEVKSVDFKNGVANLVINGKPFVLKGDSSYLIAFDWGIKFGFNPKADGSRVYDRIEVLKRGLVHQVIRKADDQQTAGFTGFNENTYWNDAFVGNTASFTGSEKAITDDVWGVKSSEGFSIFKDK